MDIVGCSKLPSDEQKRIVWRLQELVLESAEHLRSREADQVISLPTGDGMALAFFNKLDAAVMCAIEVTKSIKRESLCKIRMGIHTGPVFVMDDINGRPNISGAGINLAERVMSCGGDEHILLSDSVAQSLRQLSVWRDKIHDIGECQVKDGWVHVWNLFDGSIGNPAPSKKSRRYIQRRRLIIGSGAALALLFLLAAVVAGFSWFERMGKGDVSIAVLPFRDVSPEKGQEYFCESLAEEVLNGLQSIKGLRVSAKGSSFQFKDADNVQVVGKKLGVDNILHGSVRKEGERRRIWAQLIRASDAALLWSDTFTPDESETSTVQEQIAQKVAQALKLSLSEKNIALSGESANDRAYNAQMWGTYFLSRPNEENLRKAVVYYEQAIALDSRYAKAWLGLGRTRIFQADYGPLPLHEAYQKAREAIEHALVLSPNLAAAHAALGNISMYYDWDWYAAGASYHRALAIEPQNSEATLGLGWLALTQGRMEEAIELFRRANKVDPLSPYVFSWIGVASYYLGHQQEAIAAFQKVLELVPDRPEGHYLLGRVYLAQAMPQPALTEMGKEKDGIFRWCGLALTLHVLGRSKESDTNLAELIAKASEDAPYQVAEVYAFRGETNRAFEWLERAYAGRDEGIAQMKVDPLLKSLEGDARYTALLKKMHLL